MERIIKAYQELGLKVNIIKQEKNQLGDIFYIKVNKNVGIKDIERTLDDLKLLLKTKDITVVQDYIEGAIKLIIGNPNITYIEEEVDFKNFIVALGRNATEYITHDFKSAPHLIVAGSTGAGKSFLLHHILYSIIKNNKNFSIIPIDFKGTELVRYTKFVSKNIYSFKNNECVNTITSANMVLENAVKLMDYRYETFRQHKVLDINEYNKKYTPMERIFIVIDELADVLISKVNEEAKNAYRGDEVEVKHIKEYLIKLAQKSRGAGIHLILATQRPTVDVIDGHIKANIVTRVALKTSTALESNIILDQKGAEDLDKGEILYKGFSDIYKGKVFKVDLEKIDKVIDSFDYKETVDKEFFNEMSKWNAAKISNTFVDDTTTWGLLVSTAIYGYKAKTAYEVVELVAGMLNKTITDNLINNVCEILDYEEKLGNIRCEKDYAKISAIKTEEFLRSWKIIPITLKQETEKNRLETDVLYWLKHLSLEKRAELIIEFLKSKKEVQTW